MSRTVCMCMPVCIYVRTLYIYKHTYSCPYVSHFVYIFISVNTTDKNCMRVCIVQTMIRGFLDTRLQLKSDLWKELCDLGSFTGWRRPIECLISIGHFPQKNPGISGSLAESDRYKLRTASYGSLPLCICCCHFVLTQSTVVFTL